MTNSKNLADLSIQDVRYSLGFQGDAATAANGALLAGKETFQESREVWATVREVAAMGPVSEVPEKDLLLRRHANVLAKTADRFFGLVSFSAGGLWGITATGRIFQVESTDYGSPYLTQVRFVQVAILQGETYVPTMERYGDEFAVSDVVAFFDSYEAAHEFRSR